jgi:Flp pilus assembly protein TadB
MSAIPALLAVQISLNASTRRSYGGGLPSRTRGFRSLSERGLDLKGWRNVAYSLFVVACLLLFLVLVMATIGGGIALSALIAASFSPWWLLATLPLSVAADFGAVWLMLRVLLG